MLVSFPHSKFAVLSNGPSWWLGEKYDGIRCCWNSTRQEAYSRYGRVLSLHPALANHLPHIFVDSELWFGRGQFAATCNLVQDNGLANWDLLRITGFDIPSTETHQVPFEIRYEELLNNITVTHPFIVIALRILCNKQNMIDKFSKHSIEDGGEGIILQKKESFYEPGRSLSILKMKTSIGDQEGIIVGIDVDGSVELKLPNGSTFLVPIENVQVSPKIGEVVSFYFENNSRRDMPVNPVIFRIRADLEWADVLQSYHNEAEHRNAGFTSKPVGYWNQENMRDFMIEFASKRNLDPLLPDTWASCYDSFSQTKGGRTILSKFRGYIHALQSLLPEAEFTASSVPNFSTVQLNKIENRRDFFEKYAEQYKFDPKEAENWYAQPKQRIMLQKGSHAVVFHHNNSIPQALVDLFPDIGLDKAKFQVNAPWSERQQRRKFFEEYAKLAEFDPLQSSNWYLQSLDKMMAFKDMPRVISYHSGSIINALVDLFTDINLEKDEFQNQKLWNDPDTRREFFKDFAKDNKFYFMIPEEWYKQSRNEILQKKGSEGVLFYHNNSISKALMDLFPSVRFDRTKLRSSLSTWGSVEARRSFFEKIAADRGLDPLVAQTWYSQSIDDIMTQKGAQRVLSFHGNSVHKALLDLFPAIGLQKAKLLANASLWLSVTSRRNFFERFAQNNGFDPLIPDNWYSQPKKKILATKGVYRVIFYHNGSVTQALLDLFPSIGLDISKLTSPIGKSKFAKTKLYL